MPVNPTCPYCQSLAATAINDLHFCLVDSDPFPRKMTLYRCPQCSGMFTQSPVDGDHGPWTQGQADMRYRAEIKYPADPEGEPSPDNVLRFEKAFRFLEGKGRPIRPHDAVLEVGCGNGDFLRWSRKFPNLSSFQGLDILESPHLNIQAGSLALEGGIPYPNGSIQFLFLHHVLEHVVDLKTSIANIRNLLSTEGIAYIEVPDASRYFETAFLPFQEYNPEHLLHFTAPVLKRTLEKAGFKTLEIESGTIPWLGNAKGYPVIRGLFQKMEVPHWDDSPIKPETSALQYLWDSHRAFLEVEKKWGRIAENLRGRKVYGWGTGQFASTFFSRKPEMAKLFSAFIDQNPNKKSMTFLGKPIFLPAAEDVEKSDAIVVFSPLAEKAIRKKLKEDDRDWAQQVQVFGFTK